MVSRIQHFLNALLTACILIAITGMMLFAGYALWDNERVYAHAEIGTDEMNSIKARLADHGEINEDIQSQLKLLQQTNPDVCAWITVYNTGINYPVVQGETNMAYLSHDVNKEFSVAGSIFLDSRNNRDYTDIYSLLDGHNMSRNRMFSDVNLFKDQEFFSKNKARILLLPDKCHILKSICVILTEAGDSDFMNPTSWDKVSPEKYIDLITKAAMYVDEDGLNALKNAIEAGERPQMVALSTCSAEFTDARTILLMLAE